jgi:hypothetical protein
MSDVPLCRHGRAGGPPRQLSTRRSFAMLLGRAASARTLVDDAVALPNRAWMAACAAMTGVGLAESMALRAVRFGAPVGYMKRSKPTTTWEVT